jgi:hypothetical protein
MRKLVTLAGAVLLAGLLVGPATAADGSAPEAQPQTQSSAAQSPAQGGEQVEAAPAGTVPQAQLEYVQKREEMRKRRDEALKMRAQAVQAGN